jgi:hypothetical protein
LGSSLLSKTSLSELTKAFASAALRREADFLVDVFSVVLLREPAPRGLPFGQPRRFFPSDA